MLKDEQSKYGDLLSRKDGRQADCLNVSVDHGSSKKSNAKRFRISTESSSGFGFGLVMIYMCLDVIRHPIAWHFPKICSVFIMLAWLGTEIKKIPYQMICMLLFVGVMFADVPLSANTNVAFWTSYGMATLAISFCIPLVQFVNTQARFQKATNVLLGCYVVIGLWGATHGGFGPGGTDAAQDENYVSMWMAMGIPLAAYGAIASVGWGQKLRYLSLIPIFLLAVVFADNPSRGGFLGIISVVAYIIWYSKKRMMVLASMSLVAVFVVMIAGPAFWAEMGSIGETDTGTADHRKDLWTIATRMFLGYPISGVGPANFQWRIGDFETAEDIEKHKRSYAGSAVTHSLYFELIADLGSAGAIFFLLMVYRDFRDLFDVRKRIAEISAMMDSDPSHSASPELPDRRMLESMNYSAHGLTAALIACLVCSAFLSTLYLTYFWLQTAFIVSFKLIADQMLSIEGARPPEASYASLSKRA